MIARLFLSVALAGAIAAAPAFASVTHVIGASVRPIRPLQRIERLTFHGVTRPAQLSEVPAFAAPVAQSGPRLVHPRGYRALDVHPAARSRSAALHAAGIPIPLGPNLPVVGAEPDFFGFSGLTDVDQSMAGTGAYFGTQQTDEPPDQALCAGNGFVVDAVNNAVAVYSSFGTRLTAPTALNQFFGLLPAFSSKTGYGQFLSDPQCHFDGDTQRWFLTELEIDVSPATGNFGNHSATFIAVSQTADPTRGYDVYSFDTTDAANPGCPCFGDQPYLGADANGVFVTSNQFSINGPAFNGSQIYALSKHGLTAGHGSAIVHIDAGALPTPDGGPGSANSPTWYSIQPATAPDTSVAARVRNGTEYFLSALDFFNLNDDRVAVWALTNTASLNASVPAVGFQHVVISSVAYAAPPNATQKAGSTPLGTSVGEPLEQLQTNDDMMNQVVYAAGRLWSGLNTAVRSGAKIDAGIAYFAIAPSFDDSGFLTARAVQQGYVAVAGENIWFPSIGVGRDGRAVLAATLSGPDYYPSAVYVTPDGKVHLAGAGAGPDDGFTGYAAFGGNGAGRWGDYTAAVADADGSIWFGAEFIPGPRDKYANWGTFLGHVQTRHR